MPRPWTSTDDDTLRGHHAEGHTLTWCAKTMGRSTSMISRRAVKLGLSWDRAQVQAATAAKVADGKARRAVLQGKLLDDVERLRAQLWAPAVVFNFGGKDNTYEEHTLDKPPITDQLKLMQAVGIGIDRHVKLAEYDSGSADQVRSLLAGMAEQLGLTPQPTDPP